MYSRFILRVLPAEVVCYASEEEITRAIAPLVEKYFPKESPSGHKVTFLLDCWMVWLKNVGQSAETMVASWLQIYILSCISYINFPSRDHLERRLGEAAAGGRHCRERLAGGARVEDWVSGGGAAADENPVAPGGG